MNAQMLSDIVSALEVVFYSSFVLGLLVGLALMELVIVPIIRAVTRYLHKKSLNKVSA